MIQCAEWLVAEYIGIAIELNHLTASFNFTKVELVSITETTEKHCFQITSVQDNRNVIGLIFFSNICDIKIIT